MTDSLKHNISSKMHQQLSGPIPRTLLQPWPGESAASAGGKEPPVKEKHKLLGYETSPLPSPWQLTLVCQLLRNGQIIQEQKWIQKLLSYF